MKKFKAILEVLSAAAFFLQNIKIQTEGACYFPQEFLGEYKMQSTVTTGSNIQYSTLNVTPNSIPIWGNCHKRIGNNFILMIDYGENSCIRCLHLKLRSRNILQVLASSQETISKCFINEESARETCPTNDLINRRKAAEIVLFKTRDAEGAPTRKEYCPIDGKYSVTFTINKEDGTGFKEASLDACPSGSTLNFRFPHRSFNYEMDCLGHWDGEDRQKYLVLFDKRSLKYNEPQYRCGLYKENTDTGIIHVALSNDSTCTSDLYNASYGYETMVIVPQPESPWPDQVLYNSCNFPGWMQGNWEHLRVKANTIIFKDHFTFKTYIVKCVKIFENEERYLVFTRTQCNEERYNCLKITKRSEDILEFQLGANSTNGVLDALCADDNFEENRWTTQGRLQNSSRLSGICPISGEYTGTIPNTTDLCAKLWSDCRAPELMYYQVSDCVTLELYEEREYTCLGHWREADLLYTYTKRYDVAGTYECFVGSIVSDKEIYIKEAGEHCQRNMDPIKHGMKLTKQGQGLYSCIDSYDTSSKVPPSTTLAPSTKPWLFDIPSYSTPSPDVDNNKISSAAPIVAVCYFKILTFVVMKYF